VTRYYMVCIDTSRPRYRSLWNFTACDFSYLKVDINSSVNL